MNAARIPFPAIGWSAGAHPLERKKTGAPGATLLEFAAGFADPNWCVNGHAGLVLEGSLGFELEGAAPLVIGPGDGFVLDAGTRHRAYNAGADAVRLFIAPRS